MLLFLIIFFLPLLAGAQNFAPRQFSLPEIQKPKDALFSCPQFQKLEQKKHYPDISKKMKGVHEISPSLLPDFSDDMDRKSLLEVIKRNISYWRKKPDSFIVKMAGQSFGARQMEKSNHRLLEIFSSLQNQTEIKKILQKEFSVFLSAADDETDKIIITGYYEAEISVSERPNEKHKFPTHLRPRDLIKTTPEMNVNFDYGRIDENGNIVKHFSTEEIRSGKLDGQNLDIAWSSHPAEIMLLQIQGSGILRFSDNSFVKVGFDGANGWPFKSVQKILTDCGEIPSMNFRDFITYLTLQPLEREIRLTNLNPRYIFFKLKPPYSEPCGAMGQELVTGRSIAVDPKALPLGTAGLILSKRPVANENGEIETFKKFTRFVSAQDTGSAIRGAGRVDLFWGHGKKAEIESSSMKEEGELYIFVLKN